MLTCSGQWWYMRRKELRALAAVTCPLVVYDEETLNETLFDLLALDAIETLLYPIHLNPHPKILRKVLEMGGVFQCVSPRELQQLLALFPGITAKALLSAPDRATEQDLSLAFRNDIPVLIRDPRMIGENPRVFHNRKIFIELPADSDGKAIMRSMRSTLSRFSITLAGIFLQPQDDFSLSSTRDSWLPGLPEEYDLFAKRPVLIMGDETGIIAATQEGSIDFRSTEERTRTVHETLPRFSLWLQPGFEILAKAGVLLTAAGKTGEKQGQYGAAMQTPVYLPGEDSGRKTLHHLVNLTRLQEEIPTVTISSGQEPQGHVPLQEGEILLVTNMGAFRWDELFNDHENRALSEHYMPARSMCPVKL